MVKNSDIAKAANVSPAVVSRIVNGDETLRVSKETRDRVLRLIDEMNYTPNAAARSLRFAKAGAIALVVHDVTNPVYAEIISGAEKEAEKFGSAVLLGEASGDPARADSIEQLLAAQAIDGLILQGAGTKMDHAIAKAAQRSVPTVLLQSGQGSNTTLVRLDDVGAGVLATNHLLDMGHRNIGFIGASDHLQFAAARRRGWKKAYTDRGLPFNASATVDAASSFAEGANAIVELLSRHPNLTAAVVGNVVTAIGALSRLIDDGYAVPERFSIVSIQDADIAEYYRPALTVVRMPLRELGAVAVRTICASETFGSAEIWVNQHAVQLIERASAGPPRHTDISTKKPLG